MIKSYPNFSALDLSQRDYCIRFTDQFEPYSDFNFTSLFAWNTDGSTEIAMLNDNLVIRQPDYLDSHPVYSLLGVNQMDESIDRLLKDTPKLELVPQAVVDSLSSPASFSVKEDRDNFDYMYDLRHLSELAGSKYKKKRNRSNVFINDHSHLELEVLINRELTDYLSQEIVALDREWTKHNTRDEGDILNERRALDRLLTNFDHLKPLVITVRVNGELKAFSIAETLAQGHSIVHFEKALTVHHEHIYTFVATQSAQKLLELGAKYTNWEQDLGLEGLRRSKMSYHPVKMLTKYTIKPL